MPVEVARESWAALTDDWLALYHHVQPPAGPFVTPLFQASWWDVFDGAPDPHLLSVRDGAALIGVAPLARSGSVMAFLGDHNVSDYMDLLAALGREAEVVEAVLDHFDTDGVQQADLRGLAESSATLRCIPDAARRRGWTVQAETEAVCPTLPLAADWDSYVASLRGRYRREVRRKLRNLVDGGARVGLDVADEADGIMAGLPTLLTFMSESREDKAAFLTEQMAAFFHTLVSRLAPAGMLRLFFLKLDGVRVAAVLCFVHNDHLLMYNSGYDPQYRNLAVGLASKVLCLRDAIARGMTAVNFLRGEEDYKFQLGGRPVPVTRLRLSR